jgi:agmatinase
MVPVNLDPNAAALEGSGIFGLPYTMKQSRVVLLPVPVEITTSYRAGTASGPKAILEASKQVDLYDFSAGRVYEAGIYWMPESPTIRRLNRQGRKLALRIIKRGGKIDSSSVLKKSLAQVNAIGVRVNEFVYQKTRELISAGKIVGIIGGDHSVPFGAVQAIAEHYPGLGVLHFDAHCDLRIAYEGFKWSHASIMFNVVSRIPKVSRLVQIGIRDFCEQELEIIKKFRGRVETFFDEPMQFQKSEGQSWGRLVSSMIRRLPQDVYISFDIDALDPALCPHTGTPVPGGLSFSEAVYAIAAVARSGRRIVGFDLNEVAPGPRGDEWDGSVGARLLYKLIGHTLLSHGRKSK